ncbi:MAG: phosphate ABC transporter permease subunit PstC [Cyanobacteria bacterium M5B4]|nr:MAG: phosphate ABC transporter permease subunit PstC [Cyanobacteria bacterium M5B4]
MSSTSAPSKGKRKAREFRENIIQTLLLFAAVSSVLVTFGIMEVLVGESFRFFINPELKEVGVENIWADFFNIKDPQWTVLFEEKHFGILTLLSSTLLTSAVALIVAVPVGTTVAIYLSEFAASSLREWLKPILELLAGVPSVVFGYFALNVISPYVRSFNENIPGFNRLSAGIAIGIAIIPIISSIAEDAMRAVPNQMREGSYALGSTRINTAINVILPAAFSGIVASYILGISRAVGETMIVAVAGGLQALYSWNPLEGAATISAYIVQVTLGDVPFGSLEYESIFAAGLTLALITLALNLIGFFLIKRFKETY